MFLKSPQLSMLWDARFRGQTRVSDGRKVTPAQLHVGMQESHDQESCGIIGQSVELDGCEVK